MESFLTHAMLLFGGLLVAAVFSRVAFAISEKITRAPLLDLFISLFTWIPWATGAWLDGWPGVAAALVAQFLALHAVCLTDRLVRGKKGRTLTDAQNKLLGPVRNQLALFATVPAAVVFIGARAVEILFYPIVAWLAKMPTYRHGDWVNLSRHKYDGLIGYDLLWCWYCDWMTGLWALGSEMLRNIESFWCPIRFRDDVKNNNALTDFPDIAEWVPADGTMEDVVRAFEEHYDGTRGNSWWGHPDRKEEMTFRHATPNNHFRALRLLSEGGRWELGLSPYHHGMRLRMGLAGRPPQVMDFCLGRDETLFPKVLVAILRRLESLNETSTPQEVDAAFPWAGTRPDLAVHLAGILAA